jgi:hypothetical protein
MTQLHCIDLAIDLSKLPADARVWIPADEYPALPLGGGSIESAPPSLLFT